MTSEVIVVVDEASQPAFRAGLTGVPGFVEAANPHGDGLKELLDDVSIRVVEITTEVCSGESGQIAHSIDQKFGVFNVMTVLSSRRNRVAGFVPRRGDSSAWGTTFSSTSIAA